MTTPVLPFTQSGLNIIDPQAFYWLYGTPTGVPPVWVGESTALGLPAIGRGIDIVCNGAATMLVGADVLGPDVTERPQVVDRPWQWYGRYEFWTYVVKSLMVAGNFVGLIAARDEFGYPTQVLPVAPSSVSMDTSSGFPVYTIDGHAYTWDEVVHLRAGGGAGGLWGRGIIEQYRTSLEESLYGQRYGLNSFKQGSIPSATITLDVDELDEDVAEEVQERWMERHGGAERKPAVIARNQKIEPVVITPQDAEFVESRKLSLAECALIVGLSPSDLEAGLGGQSLTYSNLDQRQLARVEHSFGKWVRTIEEGWSDLLPPGQRMKANAEALLRTTTAERYELHKSALEAGWMTKDEVRAIEGLAPLPKDPVAEVEALTDDQFVVTA